MNKKCEEFKKTLFFIIFITLGHPKWMIDLSSLIFIEIMFKWCPEMH